MGAGPPGAACPGVRAHDSKVNASLGQVCGSPRRRLSTLASSGGKIPASSGYSISPGPAHQDQIRAVAAASWLSCALGKAGGRRAFSNVQGGNRGAGRSQQGLPLFPPWGLPRRTDTCQQYLRKPQNLGEHRPAGPGQAHPSCPSPEVLRGQRQSRDGAACTDDSSWHLCGPARQLCLEPCPG